MSDQIFLAAILGPLYLVIGLSFLIRKNTWKAMAKQWKGPELSITLIMIFNMIFGLAILAKHNDWEWSPYLIITITGWGAFLKGAAYFLIPQKATQSLIKTALKPSTFYIAGTLACLMGAWLSYLVYIN